MRLSILAVAMMAVLVMTSAPASAVTVQGSVHTTGSDFSAGTLNGLQVHQDSIAHTHDPTSVSNAQADGSWTVIGDPGGSFDTGNPAQYLPDTQKLQNYVRYDDQAGSPTTGTMEIDATIEIFEYDDEFDNGYSNNINAGLAFATESNKVFVMVMRDSDFANPWRIGSFNAGDPSSFTWLTGGFGGHEAFGGSVDVRLTYDHGSNTLTGEVFGSGSGSVSTSVNAQLTRAGVTATQDESDYLDVHDFDLSTHETTGGTYTSAAHDIDAPTEAQVDIGTLEAGTADVTVTDGNGNTLGSGSYTTGGTKTIQLDPAQQVGEQAYVNLDVSQESSGTILRMFYDEERLYFDNRAPSTSGGSPDGATLDSSSVELAIDVDDPDLGANGDSLDVEWYVNGTKVHTTTGVTSPGTVTYQTADRSDGDYQWHAEVTDSHGASTSSQTYYYSIEHGPTLIKNVQPADGTTSEYETNTLSADIEDPDFTDQGGGGDNVDVRFYVDGSLAHQETISSTQTVSTDVNLADGAHDWYVETEDKYGFVNQSNTRTLNVQHNDPSLSNLAPTGTVEYEEFTMTADVSDADFLKDGDSVDVTFYLDGDAQGTQTVTSAQTVMITAGPIADGSYSWYAEAADSYGRTYTSPTETVTVSHNAPTLSGPEPSGTIEDSEPLLNVTVNDDDFSKDGDSVEVKFYLDNSLVGTDTVTQDGGLAEIQAGPLDDGTYDLHMEATDDYGLTGSTTTQTVTVEHNDPSLTNAGPTGTVNYEENTLSVDLEDADFSGEGDSVTLEFLLDGVVVSTQAATSNGTYTHTVGPLDDGSYTWRVDATDSYDRTDTTGDLTLTIQHDDPALSGQSPDGTVNYETNTLEIDVVDADFGRDGDTVDVEFYVDGTLETTKTATSNGTVTATVGPYPDGSHTWHVKWEDDYGHNGTSATWSLNIDHAAPTVASMTDPGVTNRENVDLTVDVQDDDFLKDGDTVDVTWYVDGSQLTIKEAASAGDITATTRDLADGAHSWSVELEDDYGYTTSSSVSQFEVVHHAPVADDSSLVPTEGETLTNYTATFEVNVSDADFADPTADENVTAELYVEDEKQGTTYVTSNGTASIEVVPGYGGDVTYHWELTDIYGLQSTSQDVNITAPGSLELYNELDPTEQPGTGGDVSFYFGSGSVYTRDVVDGSVDMGGLPTDESFVAVARADGYYNRRVWVPSLFQSNNMYLIPDDADVVQQSFQLKDYSGRFPLADTVLEVQKGINGTWQTVDGDYFGADDQLNSILEYNARHRLILTNTETGLEKELGTFFPVAGGVVELRVFDDETEVYQGNVPLVTYKPDAGSLPAANQTAVTVGLDPRESGVTEYRVTAVLAGAEVHNQTYNYTEDATMTFNLTNHDGGELALNITYDLDGSTKGSQRSWDVGDEFSGGGSGLVAAAQLFLGQLGEDRAGLVAILLSALIVGFTAPAMGPRTSGTVAMMGLAAFTLLGFITVGWLAVAGAAYFVLLAVGWYP